MPTIGYLLLMEKKKKKKCYSYLRRESLKESAKMFIVCNYILEKKSSADAISAIAKEERCLHK